MTPAAVVSIVGSVHFALFLLTTRYLRGTGATTLVAFQMTGGLLLGVALAPASVVVPYQYTFLVWAIVFGYLVFGDVPHVAGLAGAGIICAAGIYLAALERTS